MSTKEEKPTLGGARIRTRKRNIQIPLDPTSFADTVITIWKDAFEEGFTQQQQLDAFVKTLETTELDFSRYGDTLFEVFFTGARLSTAAGAVAEEADKEKMEYNILSVEGTKESVMPFIKVFQIILRRRPFLIKNLENLLKRLLTQLEHYTEDQQDRTALALSLTFTNKLGIPPENLMVTLNNDALVAKGTILRFITSFFKAHLADNSLDDLITLLKKSRTDDLMSYFPMQKRNADGFKQHFEAAGLKDLVSYQEKKLSGESLQVLEAELVAHMEEYPNGVTEAIDMVKEAKAKDSLADALLIQVLWRGVMGAIQWAGKNQQQTSNAVLRQVKLWSKLLATFTSTTRLEVELINLIQLWCYEANNLMKVFQDIVRLLYDTDVVSEEAIMFWAKKGSMTKGRQLFLEAMAPFIKWLEEAEEDDDDDDE
uniref:W2 domain-containing protein n=1 Tax=Pyramimonas obovata TaxID=1411642 RepID=A0A7S0WTD3_9CHLO|mmetsp:Transcript_39144/g.85181  ORF Transcript_39144/g.85181 Transcript_39144/m.85181 type:complete len:427 (+) Transcript_39144:118-1398(+)